MYIVCSFESIFLYRIVGNFQGRKIVGREHFVEKTFAGGCKILKLSPSNFPLYNSYMYACYELGGRVDQ